MTTILTATYDGRVLVPTEPLDLPKGAKLQLRVDIPDELNPQLPGESLSGLLSFSGIMEGFPSDFAQNHDHYLHGTAKK